MKKILYCGLFLIANALHAGEADKLVMNNPPPPPLERPYLDEEGEEQLLGPLEDLDAKSGLRLVNFWALWCPPCRKEMPLLDALGAAYPEDELEVLTIATGRNEPEAIAEFFEELEVKELPKFRDPKMKLAREAGVVGLPHTIILNAKGEVIAQLVGEADYGDEELIDRILSLAE